MCNLKTGNLLVVLGAALLAGIAAPPLDAFAARSGIAVPKLDYTRDCEHSSFGKTDCLNQEEAARKTLTEKWSSYPSADKSSCMATLRTVDQLASYVVLLNCIDIEAEDREPLKGPQPP